jgi:hypothetical protein
MRFCRRRVSAKAAHIGRIIVTLSKTETQFANFS